MKKIFVVACAALLAACGSHEPKQYVGTIVDASMNNVVVRELTGSRTVDFTTEGADMQEANGLLLGNIATIEYKGELKDVTPALKVATDPTYAAAVGKWVMPDPLDSEAVMGIDLMVEGEAASIRMATLRYSGWELEGQPNRIVLRGESEGSGAPIAFTQTALLGTDSAGTPTLSIEGTEIVLTKQAL